MNRSPLRKITDDEIRTYEEDGVVCLRGILDKDWIERMRGALERVLEKPGPQGANINAEGSEGRFFYENHMWTYDDDFRAFAFESPLAEVAATVMRSATINIVYDFVITKEPHSPHPTIWHQDEEVNPLEGWQCGGNWVPLDEVTLESGAVEYVRGSHKWGVFSIVEMETIDETFFYGYDQEPPDPNRPPDRYDPLPDIEANRDQYDIVHFDTEPGDVLLNHLRCIHYAPGNFTDRRRRAIGHRWAGDDATYARRTMSYRVLPPYDPQIKNGDPFPDGDHVLYPRVWPRPGDADKSRAAE